MKSSENVYCNRSGYCPVLGFLVFFPQFTRRRGCGITTGPITAPHSFFRMPLGRSDRRATQFRRKPGFSTLRYGPGVVATPMALDASKEDVGKGGASPAPLPKVLHVGRGNPLSRFQRG